MVTGAKKTGDVRRKSLRASYDDHRRSVVRSCAQKTTRSRPSRGTRLVRTGAAGRRLSRRLRGVARPRARPRRVRPFFSHRADSEIALLTSRDRGEHASRAQGGEADVEGRIRRYRDDAGRRPLGDSEAPHDLQREHEIRQDRNGAEHDERGRDRVLHPHPQTLFHNCLRTRSDADRCTMLYARTYTFASRLSMRSDGIRDGNRTRTPRAGRGIARSLRAFAQAPSI